MADAAVEFLLENLPQLLTKNGNIQGEVEQLVENVNFFKSFLEKVSGKKLRKDEALRSLVGRIRTIIYDADDVMDACSQAAEIKAKTFTYFTGGADLIDIAKKVNDICNKSNEIYEIYGGKDELDLIKFATDDGLDDKPQQPIPLEEANVVGREDEVEKLIGYLHKKTEYLDVISITGMPGVGKTTLTGKIFHDPHIQYEFPIRIWVYISDEFKEKEVFLSILKYLRYRLDEDEYNKKNARELAEEIAAYLGKVKFLLVMDDVWEPSDWDKLKVVLPKHNMQGKVIITSRQERVGWHASRLRGPHYKLRCLSLDESCELLRQAVFDKAEFPPELVKVGKEIAGECEGLPIAILVIGGILITKVSKSVAAWEKVAKSVTTKVSKSVAAWEKVAKSVTTFLYDHDPLRRIDRIISISYDKLHNHLKECFLYFGMFPEDYEIPAWKLMQMWIADGLLIHPKDGTTIEDIAEIYLDDLIDSNLVRVEKSKADGRVKTCHIHGVVSAFCKREGANDNEIFLREIKQSLDGTLQPLVTEVEKHRRLCIHSNVLDFLSKNPRGPFVRSFVTFSEDIEMPTERISAISAAFKLLRVLEAQPLKFKKLPSDFYHLLHLRYLVLSLKPDSDSKPASLPEEFNKFRNIQTLIVNTTSHVLEIKADVMNMTQLRHLETNASTTLAKPGKESNQGEKLQTLCTMSPESCSEAILGRARNLKKLGIRGKIALFLDGKVGSIDSVMKLDKLEKLKLLNDMFPNPTSSGKLDGLPPPYKFPPKLKSLTLVATYLDWTNMSVLALLENLQVLKLKGNAFMGSHWNVDHKGFETLEFLRIDGTNLLIWQASIGHFPSLKRLELHNCGKLKLIPIALAYVPTFEYLDIQHCKDAVSSAMKIAAATKNVSTFKLSVVPSIDSKLL